MKKLLALVLAMVMTLGLATVSSSAAYSDKADISLKEAVDVMSAVGVFQGADGKFSPKANLNREQAAKLIAYLDLGEDAAEALPAVKVFSDVPATSWSAKYIAYCADAGYIAGDGTGKFNPAGELNGYAFGKMLLCVLGYDASIEGFVGNTWSINVAKLMEKNDIADGIDGAASATLTREQAAQYCLNALQADMVDYETKGTNVTINGAVIATGASAAKKVEIETEGTKNYAGKETTDAGYGYQQLCEKLYGTKLTLAGTTDAFYRSMDRWTYDGSKVGDYADSTPDLTYTAAVSGGTLYTDLGKPDSFTIDALYVDGVQATIADGTGTGLKDITVDGIAGKYADEFGIKSGNKVKLGGEGTLVEVYKSSTANHYTIVIVNTYVDSIKAWKAATLDKNGDVDKKEYVTLNSNLTFETTAFSKQDATDGTVVLVTKSWKNTTEPTTAATTATVKSVVKAEVVEDVAVTSYKAANNLNSYKINANAVIATGHPVMTGGATYDLYLDSYGNVITIDEHTSSSTDYVFVVSQSATPQGDDVTGEYFNVKYVDMAGKTTVVRTYGDTGLDLATDGYIYTVEEDSDHSGYYEFTKVTSKSGTLTTMNKTTPTVATGIVANNKTTYVICTDNDKDTYKVVTGLSNVSSYSLTSATTAYAVIKDSYATVIFVDMTAATVGSITSEDVIYLVKDETPSLNYDASTKTSYYEVAAVVDGAYTSVKVTKDAFEATGAGALKYGFVTRDINSDGYVTATKAYADDLFVTGTIASGKEVTYSDPTLTAPVKVGEAAEASESIVLTSDATIYLVDLDEETCETVTAAELDGTTDSKTEIGFFRVSSSDSSVKTLYFVTNA